MNQVITRLDPVQLHCVLNQVPGTLPSTVGAAGNEPGPISETPGGWGRGVPRPQCGHQEEIIEGSLQDKTAEMQADAALLFQAVRSVCRLGRRRM